MTELFVCGMGPGNRENMTLGVARALQDCDTIVGYTVYLDLLRQDYPDKEFLSTPMTGEVKRCSMALAEAEKGKKVVMVSSGDSGLYGMASLLFELRGEKKEPEIRVLPGISAAFAGAALLGSPMTHDTALISLSDRLTPWDLIEKRLEKAAEGDFCIAIYNPRSKTRPDHLKRAVRILLTVLPPDRLCGVCHQIGREGEAWKLLPLKDLEEYPADMFTTVFIGNAMTREIAGRMVTPRGYHHG